MNIKIFFLLHLPILLHGSNILFLTSNLEKDVKDSSRIQALINNEHAVLIQSIESVDENKVVEFRPDLIHAFTSSQITLNYAQLFKVSYIISLPDDIEYSHSSFNSNLLKNAKAIVTTNQETQTYFDNLNIPIYIINHCISIKPTFYSFRHALKMSRDTFLITVFGIIEASNNQLMIMEQLQNIYADYPRINILFIGKSQSDEYSKTFFETLKANPWMHHIESVDQNKIYNAYIDSNVIIHGSTKKSNNIFLETALLIGKPVIALDIPIHSQLIRQGHSGLLCHPLFPVDISNSVALLYRDKEYRERLAFNGKSDHGKRCNNKEKEEYLNLYKQIIS